MFGLIKMETETYGLVIGKFRWEECLPDHFADSHTFIDATTTNGPYFRAYWADDREPFYVYSLKFAPHRNRMAPWELFMSSECANFTNMIEAMLYVEAL